MNENKENMIELEEDWAVISIPKDTIELTIDAVIYSDRKTTEASRTLSPAEVREAFRLAEEGFVDPDAVYTLTDKGRAWLEENGI